ncbi:DUF3846 domain-containing protein [Pseudoflavonifractor sp. HCP28S3_F10]|uniref:DUF3846 domain-containing protein n=1 Tax=Pseudoflavonifractor sp. HCP28S3_F10 TaxID=3438947 RepID=UPI003F8AC84B
MLILMVEPGKTPYPAQMEDSLEVMQAAVGGLIQALYPFDDSVALVCNDEGKLLGLPPNRALRDEEGNIYDVVCGIMFLCGAPPDSENFCSLTPEQIKKYEKHFRYPEVFLRTERGIICLPVED